MKFHVTLMGLAALTAAFAATRANAASVVVSPVADADIRAGSPTAPFDRSVILVGGNSASSWAKGYARFELPADFGTATAATFTVSAAISRTFSVNVLVHGLDDGVAGEADWVAAHSGGMTWNTAPGNDTAGGGFVNSALLGNFTIPASTPAGGSYSINAADLVNFINADSNGFVTLMMNFSTSTSSNMQFAADAWNGPGADTGFPGPRLSLEYEPIPEPASLSLAAVVGGFLLMGARRRR